MAQHPRIDVAHAAERIDQVAFLALGDRVDGEVAPRQILLERHRGIGVHHESGVAARGLALGARQRVFLGGLRMQEHREVAPDLFESGRQHRLDAFAHHHVIAVAAFDAEQAIADRAADEIALHADSLAGAAISTCSVPAPP